MIPSRYRDLVFMFVMTLLMGLAISGVMTLVNGWSGSFVHVWLTAFARTYVIVVPTVLVVLPVARRVTSALVRDGAPSAPNPREPAPQLRQPPASPHHSSASPSISSTALHDRRTS